MPNTNCLAGMRCPKCGSEGPFRIGCQVSCIAYDNGVETYENPEWYNSDSCVCMMCSHGSDVAGFSEDETEKAEGGDTHECQECCHKEQAKAVYKVWIHIEKISTSPDGETHYEDVSPFPVVLGEFDSFDEADAAVVELTGESTK